MELLITLAIVFGVLFVVVIIYALGFRAKLREIEDVSYEASYKRARRVKTTQVYRSLQPVHLSVRIDDGTIGQARGEIISACRDMFFPVEDFLRKDQIGLSVEDRHLILTFVDAVKQPGHLFTWGIYRFQLRYYTMKPIT